MILWRNALPGGQRLPSNVKIVVNGKPFGMDHFTVFVFHWIPPNLKFYQQQKFPLVIQDSLLICCIHEIIYSKAVRKYFVYPFTDLFKCYLLHSLCGENIKPQTFQQYLKGLKQCPKHKAIIYALLHHLKNCLQVLFQYKT